MQYTMGSLFDGSGGFPLAASLCGIEPRWASEVEPYPIAVTRSRFPNVKHLGDISKVSGAEIEPVDIITFGSPCQDLSVAGKQRGMKHEANGDGETTRSGLFMEAVRIIREMREATNGEYPNFALWENVPGAFSSKKGEDFRTVLAELIGIVEPNAVMPPVPKGGWNYADSYTGDGWSLAYRVFDAQYWGVPQRRRRIHLVLDLRGERARKVLFEREGVRGYFAQGGAQGQGIAANAAGSTRAAGFKAGNGAKAGSIGYEEEVSPTLSACPSGTNQAPAVVYCLQGNGIDRALTAGCNGKGWKEDVSYTLNTIDRPAVAYGFRTDNSAESRSIGFQRENAPTICSVHPPAVVFDKELYNSGRNSNGGHYVSEGGVAPTLRSTGHPPGCAVDYIVRRLTPTECARLQGFADRWGDIDKKDSFTVEEYRFWLDVRNTHAAINGRGAKEYSEPQMLTWYNKLHTDSAEYKMWGNGIALPPALYCMQGMADALAAKEDDEEWAADLRLLKQMAAEDQETETEGDITCLDGAPEEIKEAIMENAENLGMNAETEDQKPESKPGCVSFELSGEASKKLLNQEHDDHAEDILKRIEAEAMYNIVRDENIRLTVERDLYRDMYHNLLNKLMGDGA